MLMKKLEKILLVATNGEKVIPPRSLLVASGLTDSEARNFSIYLKNKGYVRLSLLKRRLLDKAEIEFEARKYSISSDLENAISTSVR
jgi:hypothetical protein